MHSSVKLLAMLVAILVFLQASSRALGKTDVQIHNALPGEPLLTVHCKSKDDDLGFHQIQGGSRWGFSFKPSIFGNTLFFCSFQWPGAFHYFDVYIQKRDIDRCDDWCVWFVKPDGPCLYNKFCEKWNS